MSTRAMVLKLAESRQNFYRAVARMAEEELSTVAVEGEWTVIDLMGHIASWERSVLEPLERYRGEGSFQAEVIPDHTAWNDRQARKWRELSFEQVRADMEAVRQKLVAVAEELGDERMEKVFPAPWGGDERLVDMLSGLAWHENEHTRSILQVATK